MSCFDGNFMETTSYWAPPPSPSLGTILAMLNQADNGLNPMTEIFSQNNLPSDHSIDQSQQRSGLGERLAARTGFNPPRIETQNISPCAELFGSSTVHVPSPIVAVSPGFSPSALLLSPNMFSNSSQIMPLMSPIPNYGPPETVVNSGELEGHATTMISNNELTHQQPVVNSGELEGHAMTTISNNELTHQPLQINLPPPQEGSADIAMDESVYIPPHESRVEPLGAPLVASFESQVVDEANINIISINEKSEDEDDDDDDFDEEDDEDDDDDDDGEDNVIINEPEIEPPAPKRRRYETPSNMVGAIRTNKVPRVIIQMENEEINPDDGYRWRKYGQKVVKGNPNPRSYYKCTYEGCDVKKHIERGADDDRIAVITYDGIHEHAPPATRVSSSSKTRSDSSMSPDDDNHSGPTIRLGRPPASSYYTSRSTEMRPFTPSDPPMDMTQIYRTGLSKLPSLPVRQNSGFTYQNNEPNFVDATSNGTGVYKGIMDRLYAQFGAKSKTKRFGDKE